MGRGKRKDTVARNAPEGHIVPLSDGGRGKRVPKQLAEALTTVSDPEAEIEQAAAPTVPLAPTSGIHTLSLKITDAMVAVHIGTNGDPNDPVSLAEEAFHDACCDESLALHSTDADITNLTEVDPGQQMEVTVSDNDGDLIVTYICEKV
jgi:hypothetical protein